MEKKRISTGVFLVLLLSLLISCSKNNELTNQTLQENLSVQNKKPVPESRSLITGVNVSVSVFAPNIVYPRGLKFGPDGYLYVALAGFGGKDSTIGKCTQVVPPVGPYKGGYTSKIIKISRNGTVSTVADKLPSDINALGFTEGVSDVEFVEDDLYATLVAGCSHASSVPTSVIKLNRKNGKWSVLADLSTYYASHPVAAPEIDDFEPDGDPYSLIYVKGTFFAIEPNHGELLKITKSGNVSRVIDFSAHFGHIVPTVVTFHEGNFFVGNLRTFPLVAGSSDIYKVTPGGQVEVFATGFTGVLGVAFDKHDRLYVLETSAGGGPIPNTGRVVRVNSDNSRDVIVDKLFFPTGMTFGPDGALYISNTGFGPPTGQILKVVFKNDEDQKDENHRDNEQ